MAARGLKAIRLGLEEWIRRRPFLFTVLTAAVLGVATLAAPVALQREALAPFNDQSRVYFGSFASVGQSFVSLSGLRELRVPVGRRPEARGPITLHLRSEYFGEDIRSATVFVPNAETEDMVFQFEPLGNPPAQLLWVLEAPHGPQQAYWAYREQDAAAFPEGTAFLSGRGIRGNFAFTQIGSQLKLVALQVQIASDMHIWEKQSLILFLAGAALFFLLAPWGRRLAIPPWLGVGGLVLATVALHIYFARQLPLIIDEGAYLQDAEQTTWTFWPLRDFLTKGPVYVLLLKLWRFLVPDTLTAWRLFSAVSWAGVVAAVALLARRFRLPVSVQIMAAALLALLPGVVSATTPLLLQVTSTLFAVLALLALLKGAQENRARFIVFAALLMVAGYLTRASTAAAGVAGAVAVWLFTQGDMRARMRAEVTYVGVGLLAIVLVAGAAFFLMGPQKTAVLLNIEALTVGKLQTAQAGNAEPPIRWATQAAEILWRGGSWILAGVVALPLFAVRRLPAWTCILLAGAGALIFANMAYHLSDMGYLLPGDFLITRVTMLVIVFGLPLAWLLRSLLVPEKTIEAALPWQWLVVLAVWIGVSSVLYRGWGAYRPQYIVEFLPPLALLSAAALTQGWRLLQKRPLARALIAGLFLANWWQGTFLLITRPVSGTIAPEAIQELSQFIQREVPPGEEIFTAQPIVTAAARRPIVAGYSHPGWILYSRLQRVPDSLRQIYFAEADEITEWLRQDVQFVVSDERTNEVYFDAYPARQQILADQFELIGEVPNDLTEEPFRLYRRKGYVHR